VTIYRLAKKTDALELAALRWALKIGDDAISDVADKADFAGKFVAWMNTTQEEDIVHWVAERDARLIGVISVRVIRKMPSPDRLDGRFGYITNTYVLPQHRNTGVGTALLAAVKDWSVGEDLELLVVWPSELAYPFYERGGYRRYPDPVVLVLRGD
jgi:GNAT superfamily N-acetyltransferase